MRIFFAAIFVFCANFCVAQNVDAEMLINEGVKLHDEGKYEFALSKYREALSLDPDNQRVLYEISFTFFDWQKFDSCIFYSEKLIKMKADDKILKGVFVNLGSCYDILKMPEKSIKSYNEGLKKFPDYYLLHFNKGITYIGTKEYADAKKSFEESISLYPQYISSHYWLSKILADENKIPSILAAVMVCILENNTKRSTETSSYIINAMKSNVNKTDNGTNITLFMPPDGGKKKAENDFSAVELLVSLMEASSITGTDSLKLDTEEKKLSFSLQMMFSGLDDNKKKKGFYWKYYAPFYAELKKKEYTDVLSRIILLNKNTETCKQWLLDNKAKTSDFYDWLTAYQWPKQ